jgi:type II secretory pathway component PulF
MKAAKKRVAPPEALTIFTRRLSAAMRFGVPLACPIAVSSGEATNIRLRQAIGRIRKSTTGGAPLSEALYKESRFSPFPRWYLDVELFAE